MFAEPETLLEKLGIYFKLTFGSFMLAQDMLVTFIPLPSLIFLPLLMRAPPPGPTKSSSTFMALYGFVFTLGPKGFKQSCQLKTGVDYTPEHG